MIYLVADTARSICKIGFSNNFHTRLASLNTGYPFEFDKIIERDGGKFDEQCIMHALRHKRVKGEWFLFDAETEEEFSNHDMHEDDVTRFVRNSISGYAHAIDLTKATGVSMRNIMSIHRGACLHYSEDDINKLAAYLKGDGE